MFKKDKTKICLGISVTLHVAFMILLLIAGGGSGSHKGRGDGKGGPHKFKGVDVDSVIEKEKVEVEVVYRPPPETKNDVPVPKPKPSKQQIKDCPGKWYGGLGIEMFVDEVSVVFKGYAADKAGIQVGDQILSISGSGQPLGDPGTEVDIKINRRGVEIMLHAVREKICY